MSIITTSDGKVVKTSAGKSLNFNNLISAANATTGESDATLTDAVQSLIDGFGGGGGLPAGIQEISTGTYTPTTNEGTWFGKAFNHGMSEAAKWVVMWDEDGVIATSYEVTSAFSGYGVATGNYRAGNTQHKYTGASNGSNGYIEALSSSDLGKYGGIRPDYSSAEFKAAWYSGANLIAGHTYRWVAGR